MIDTSYNNVGKYLQKVNETFKNKENKSLTDILESFRLVSEEYHNLSNKEQKFEYDWHLPLSKYNTLRYEDSNRKEWIERAVGKFVRNDRFVCEEKPTQVIVQIRKEYVVSL